MDVLGNTFFLVWEPEVIAWFQSWIGPVGTALSKFFSLFGQEYILIAVMGFLYWCYDKQFGVFVGTSVFTSLVWNPMVKNLFFRLRPYFVHETVQCLQPVDAKADLYDVVAQGYSFPSGHSTVAAAAYGALGAYSKKRWLWVVGTVLPLLVGISRVCLGAHYPTDVLVGWALGAVTVAVLMLLRKVRKPWFTYLLVTLTAVPGWFYCRSADFYTGFGMLVGGFAGFLFEARFVRFENTRSWVRSILRLVGGIAVFLAMNTLMKLPFSDEFLDSPTMAAFAVRAARYAVDCFLVIAVYPMLFRCTAKLGRKKS